MTLGGLAVVGTTALIAATHGSLGALLGALAVGTGTYASTRKVLNLIPEKVERTQTRILELEVKREIAKHLAASKKAPGDDKDEAKIKAIKKDAKAVVDGLHEVCEQDKWGNREMAACAGVAGFAYPPLGLAILAGNLAVMVGALDNINSLPPPAPAVDWEQAVQKAMAAAAA